MHSVKWQTGLAINAWPKVHDYAGPRAREACGVLSDAGHEASAGSSSATYQVLHLCGNVQCNLSCGATSAPGDIAEDWSIRSHAVQPVQQVLHTLRTRNAGNYQRTLPCCGELVARRIRRRALMSMPLSKVTCLLSPWGEELKGKEGLALLELLIDLINDLHLSGLRMRR